eukprot:10559865-Alexandrium_andersonii.AAC.1
MTLGARSLRRRLPLGWRIAGGAAHSEGQAVFRGRRNCRGRRCSPGPRQNPGGARAVQGCAGR